MRDRSPSSHPQHLPMQPFRARALLSVFRWIPLRLITQCLLLLTLMLDFIQSLDCSVLTVARLGMLLLSVSDSMDFRLVIGTTNLLLLRLDILLRLVLHQEDITINSLGHKLRTTSFLSNSNTTSLMLLRMFHLRR